MRTRQTLAGTSERPRLCVHRSSKHIRAQVVDDQTGRTLAAAKIVGKAIAERARDKGIEKVVYDRGGYQYHGRVKALAEAAREAGLKF